MLTKVIFLQLSRITDPFAPKNGIAVWYREPAMGTTTTYSHRCEMDTTMTKVFRLGEDELHRPLNKYCSFHLRYGLMQDISWQLYSSCQTSIHLPGLPFTQWIPPLDGNLDRPLSSKSCKDFFLLLAGLWFLCECSPYMQLPQIERLDSHSKNSIQNKESKVIFSQLCLRCCVILQCSESLIT